MKSECRRRVLARNSTAMLEACACGSLHLSLGPMTLRLDAGAAQEIANVLFLGLGARVQSEPERAEGPHH